MKFTKDGFRGVRDGEIYATVFAKGEDCPKELELAALEQGFVGKKNANNAQDDLLVENAVEQSENAVE